MKSLISQTLRINKFDAIYIHLFRMAQFVVDHKNQYRILDLTDVISNEIKRSLPYRNILWKLLYKIEYPRIVRYEKKLVSLFEEIWLISTADQRILDTDNYHSNIITITNGIDSQVFHPIQVDQVPFSLIFTGHMGIPHNIDAARYFALDIFPDIQKLFPESIFVIAGAEPSKYVLELASKPNIKVLGYVEDLNYVLNRYQIFIAPLRFAAGVQNKVLEAMAAGKPVVTTKIVNEGIGASEEEEILVAEASDEWIKQISRLFQDVELRERVGLSGSNFVRNKFSWDIVLRHINTLEDQLANHRNN
jgi:glycosyltransferase involved in cell wall biosynthesis